MKEQFAGSVRDKGAQLTQLCRSGGNLGREQRDSSNTRDNLSNLENTREVSIQHQKKMYIYIYMWGYCKV